MAMATGGVSLLLLQSSRGTRLLGLGPKFHFVRNHASLKVCATLAEGRVVIRMSRKRLDW
jgi:hypothetical protein